ncbi:MAG: prepilin-type N-terminal cleavage/methylation domain-containing protein [Elusimicrobia bacterium]|nr:prepilin-type N-terminal cleavage/methylation domain-containing protein [Elusimicrobiota bacterium]
MKNKGFTLIELMIVVAVIGILAAIAIPKFGNLLRTAKEGATKGSLGSIRSAITIYYGEMEGEYPVAVKADGSSPVNNESISTFDSAPMITKYIDKCPSVRLGRPGLIDSNECIYCLSLGALTVVAGQSGKWWYRGQQVGDLLIAASDFKDIRGNYITNW